MDKRNRIFRGDKPLEELPDPPPWRQFRDKENRIERGATYQASDEEVNLVNAALYLRRPLLITGRPGTGKSSLAHAVAHELKLGDVLIWPITSKSTLQHGLYNYDAIGRLQDASQRAKPAPVGDSKPPALPVPAEVVEEIGRFIRLGPIGTAFLLSEPKRPRMVLIDEIDKSDIDLPNDLLHLFEEGEFEIVELARMQQNAQRGSVAVLAHGSNETLEVPRNGTVRCQAFPLIIMTSNGEREFPPAFLRRCLRLQLDPPDGEKIKDIVQAHLNLLAADKDVAALINSFLDLRDSQHKELAVDQLLNALYLLKNDVNLMQPDKAQLRRAILSSLAE